LNRQLALAAACLAILTTGGAYRAPAPAPIPAYVAKAVADPTRPKAEIAADALRDPADTLAFAGVEPGMIVAELYPGAGYFSRLISDIVGPRGHVYGIEKAEWKEAVALNQAMLNEPGRSNYSLQVQPFGAFDLPRQVDLVWITQNYHDLHIAKYGPVDMADFNRRVFHALKPGGIYFIADQQANPGTTEAQIAVLHRIEKAQVIREVTAAGFKLVGEGTFLHRAGDDHTLPIFDPKVQGRTDQYALKFVRPKG
jgi:predicted methyltransferase